MTNFNDRVRQWTGAVAANREAREVEAILREPPPRTNPALLELVPVKTLRAFFVDGKLIDAGMHVSLPRHVADDMRALGRCEIL